MSAMAVTSASSSFVLSAAPSEPWAGMLSRLNVGVSAKKSTTHCRPRATAVLVFDWRPSQGESSAVPARRCHRGQGYVGADRPGRADEGGESTPRPRQVVHGHVFHVLHRELRLRLQPSTARRARSPWSCRDTGRKGSRPAPGLGPCSRRVVGVLEGSRLPGRPWSATRRTSGTGPSRWRKANRRRRASGRRIRTCGPA